MKTKIFTTLLVLVIVTSHVLASALTLADLETMCKKQSWEAVNVFLANKGWEYYDSESEYIAKNIYNQTITWAFERDRWEDKAVGWLYLYTDGSANGKPAAITLQDSRQEIYTKILSAINSKGYKQINSKIETGKTIVTYENASYTLTITTQKQEEKEKYSTSSQYVTIRLFRLCCKGGFYDDSNGKKTRYYSNGNIKSTYTLVGGKKHGTYFGYHENGKLKVEIPFKNGKADGKIKGFYENGNIRIEASMKNGNRVGPATCYFYDDEELTTKWIGDFTVEILDMVFLDIISIYVGDDDYCNFVEYEYEHGQIIAETHVQLKDKNDRKHITTYNADKQLLYDAYYLGDSIHGKAIYKTYKDKQLEEENIVYYNEGIRDGLSTNKTYENGELSSIEQCVYKDGAPDGLYTCTFYRGDSLKIKIQLYYNNGKKNGREQWIVTDHDSSYVYQYHTYANDQLVGPFQEITEDSIIIGSYNQEGKLHGQYAVYIDKIHSIKGGLATTDTSKLEISCIGKYENGHKIGLWKYYDAGLLTNNVLRAEGNYSSDRKNGIWKFYYPSRVPFVAYYDTVLSDSVWIFRKTSHGGELYLEQTYKDDKLDGLSVRYSYIDNSMNDSTYQKVNIKSHFRNDVLHGEYVYQDALGRVVMQGNYRDGMREGVWNYFFGDPENGIAQAQVKYSSGRWEQTQTEKDELKYVYDAVLDNSFRVTTSKDENVISEQAFYAPSRIREELDSARILVPNILSPDVYLNGKSTFYDNQGCVIKEMYYAKGQIYGNVTEYLYSQNVKRISNEANNYEIFQKITNDKPYSGVVEYKIDTEYKQMIKVKKGVRNGKTKDIDIKTNKVINITNYKNGEIK